MSDYSIGKLIVAIEPLVNAGTRYLKTLELESQIRLKLMELEAQLMQMSQAVVDKEPKGLMKAPFGYCPECGEVGVGRSNKLTRCAQDHVHESEKFTVLQKPEHKQEPLRSSHD